MPQAKCHFLFRSYYIYFCLFCFRAWGQEQFIFIRYFSGRSFVMASDIFYSDSTASRTGNPQKGEYIARNIYIHYNAKSNTLGRIYVLRVRSRSNLAPNQDESVAWDRTSISRIASQHLRPDYLIRRPDSAMRSLSSVTQSVLMVETNGFIDPDKDMVVSITTLMEIPSNIVLQL